MFKGVKLIIDSECYFDRSGVLLLFRITQVGSNAVLATFEIADDRIARLPLIRFESLRFSHHRLAHCPDRVLELFLEYFRKFRRLEDGKIAQVVHELGEISHGI